MNRTIRVTALALIGTSLLAAAVALSVPPGGRSAAAATQMVAVQNFQFSPATLTISVGDTVHWDWPAAPNDIPHTVTSADLQLDSPMQAVGSYSHIFNAVGTYNYQCNVHPDVMQGTIVVQVAAPPTSTSTVAATTTSAPTATRTMTPVATGTPASATPVTPTNTSGITPTIIAPVSPVAPAGPGGAAGAGGLPRAGTGKEAGGLPLSWFSAGLAAAGLAALGGAAASRRRR